MGAEVSGAADGEMKNTWGKLAYLRASLEVARQYEAKEVTLTLDGVERKLRAVNLAIGNCRYAGSGWLAAPRANPEDGLLDLVVIEDVGLLEVLKLTPTVLAELDYLDKEGVFFARAREIRVESSPGSLEFTVDGEVIGDEPAAAEARVEMEPAGEAVDAVAVERPVHLEHRRVPGEAVQIGAQPRRHRAGVPRARALRRLGQVDRLRAARVGRTEFVARLDVGAAHPGAARTRVHCG